MATIGLGIASPATAQVLDIGDSHTYFSDLGAAHPAWEVDALGGRNSSAGVEVLKDRLRRRHSQVVFDLATNDVDDPETFADNLRRVWALLGSDRRLTLVTTLIPQWPGAGVGVNQAIWRFARHHPRRVEVARWNQLASQHTEFWAEDGVHFTVAGYRARTRLIRDMMRG